MISKKGSELSASEFLKIDKTKLAEVLLEEPNFKIKGVTDNIERKVQKDDIDEELKLLEEEEKLLDERISENLKEEHSSEEEDDFELYAFLRKESENSKNLNYNDTPIIKEEFELLPYKVIILTLHFNFNRMILNILMIDFN